MAKLKGIEKTDNEVIEVNTRDFLSEMGYKTRFSLTLLYKATRGYHSSVSQPIIENIYDPKDNRIKNSQTLEEAQLELIEYEKNNIQDFYYSQEKNIQKLLRRKKSFLPKLNKNKKSIQKKIKNAEQIKERFEQTFQPEFKKEILNSTKVKFLPEKSLIKPYLNIGDEIFYLSIQFNTKNKIEPIKIKKEKVIISNVSVYEIEAEKFNFLLSYQYENLNIGIDIKIENNQNLKEHGIIGESPTGNSYLFLTEEDRNRFIENFKTSALKQINML